MTLYDVLGVGPTASAFAVKSAYRRKVKETHPDAGGDPADFRRVREAWEILGDPNRRARYNEIQGLGGFDYNPNPVENDEPQWEAPGEQPFEETPTSWNCIDFMCTSTAGFSCADCMASMCGHFAVRISDFSMDTSQVLCIPCKLKRQERFQAERKTKLTG
jgi:DnaJ-class molecular chaperone